jgi:4-hydroxybenzoate polyprenyltransferase
MCVSLDGGLFLTDAFMESLCQLLKKSPWRVILMPVWLLGGRANFKRQVMRRAGLGDHARMVNPEVASFLETAKKEGRKVVLAAWEQDRRAAVSVQQLMGVFDEVVFVESGSPPSGAARAAVMEERFGRKNFDYLGSRPLDLPTWQAARVAYVASRDQGLIARVKKVALVEGVFAPPCASLRDWLRALRVHHWSKNLLLLLPLLCAHQWTEPARLWPVILGLAAFSLCASNVYVLNDLLDLEADRQHASKRNRPFASGRIPLAQGLVSAPVLLALASGLAALLGWRFCAVFGAYYCLTLAYSLRLKEIALVDVLVLAGLYSIRILAGGVAAQVPVSDWLIMFSLFVFLSLAFAKRFAEIQSLRDGATRLQGRGYMAGDAEPAGSMGVGSGYISVLVLAMYINHPSVTSLYSHPHVLWLACPLLLYWISRVWLLVHRGALPGDPVWFALRDGQSWLVAALLMAVGFAAGPK